MVSAISSEADSSSRLQLIQQRLDSRIEPPQDDGDRTERMQARFTSAAEALGLDAASISELRSEIEAAVAAVKESGDNTGDQREQFMQAVDGVLEENGIDPAEFKTQTDAMHQTMGMGGRRSGGGAESEDTADETNLLSYLKQQSSSGTSTDLMSLLQQFRNLPAGSLIDTAA